MLITSVKQFVVGQPVVAFMGGTAYKTKVKKVGRRYVTIDYLDTQFELIGVSCEYLVNRNYSNDLLFASAEAYETYLAGLEYRKKCGDMYDSFQGYLSPTSYFWKELYSFFCKCVDKPVEPVGVNVKYVELQ